MHCEHRGCHCEERTIERAGQMFCSDFCANAQTTGQHQTRCGCGHSDCREA